jgi:Tfp pilus assembly protein PilZ
MNDKRAFSRKRKRLLAEILVDGRTVTAFTWDLSHTGLFLSSHYVPKLGEKLSAVLHLPNGKKVRCEGTVVRIRRVPTALSEGEANNGFCLALGGYFEEYARFMGELG